MGSALKNYLDSKQHMQQRKVEQVHDRKVHIEKTKQRINQHVTQQSRKVSNVGEKGKEYLWQKQSMAKQRTQSPNRARSGPAR